MKQLSKFLSVALLSSCASLIFDPIENNLGPIQRIENAQVETLAVSNLASVGIPKRQPVVAVYPTSFTDQTGQRLSNSSYASFSTAITQLPSAYLIRALHKAGSDNGGFFTVVERVGLDNLTKERQIIRSTREQKEDKVELGALLFAGLIIEGGVIGYESNVTSGGAGARYLGLGATKAYRRDSVTVQLRLVSVTSGKVLLETLVTKTILSASLSNDVFRFISDDTELVEIESGVVRNESGGLALRAAIETAVLQIIKEGTEAGYWSIDEKFKNIDCDDACVTAIRG
jgi:curli production assembly/transport component CsgG